MGNSMMPDRHWLLCGESILDKYTLRLLSRALRDLDGIYAYVARTLRAPDTAVKMIDETEAAILSLEQFPYRGAERKTGACANRDYRQLFVKNYTIVYRVDEARKQVVVVTARYSPAQR